MNVALLQLSKNSDVCCVPIVRMVARDTWFWETHLAIGNPRDFDRRCMCNIDFMKRAVITELGYKSEILYLPYFGYFIYLFLSFPFPSLPFYPYLYITMRVLLTTTLATLLSMVVAAGNDAAATDDNPYKVLELVDGSNFCTFLPPKDSTDR